MKFLSLFKHTYKKGNNIIVVLLVQYLLIFLIPSLTMFFIYSSTVRAIEKELLEKNHMLLDASKNAVDKGLSEVSMALQQLESNPSVLNFKRLDRPIYGSNVIRASELQTELQNYRLQSELIYDYYILYTGNRIAIGPNVIASMDDFYGTCFQYEGEPETQWYEEWMVKYRNSYLTFLPSRKVHVFDKELSAIAVIKPVTYLNRYQDITIVILLNEKELQKRIGSIDNTSASSIFILDKDSNRLTSSSKTEEFDLPAIIRGNPGLTAQGSGEQIIEINGEERLITYTTSNNTGWRYLSVQSFGKVLSKADSIKRTIIVFIAADLVAGLFIIFALLYTNGRPAKKLMNMVMDSENTAKRSYFNLFKPIQNVVAALENKYVDISKKMDEQKSFLTVAFFERLYNGSFKADEDVDAISAHIGLDIRAGFYTVVLFCLNGYDAALSGDRLDEMNVKRFILKERLKSLSGSGKRILLHDPHNNEVAMLILGDSPSIAQEREELRQIIAEAGKMAEDMEELNASVYIGSTCDQLLKVAVSMNAARQCLNYGRTILQDSRIVWHEDISGVFTGYHYPREAENRLVNCVLCGNWEDAAAILDEIYDENMGKRHLPPSMLQLLSHELCGTMLRMLDSGHIEKSQLLIGKLNTEIEAIGRIQDANLLKTRMKEMFESCCSLVSQRKKERDLIHTVLEYLNANYHRVDIALSTITEMFNVSQTYLSKHFKERTGCSVYEYLEKVRIEHACRLLREKDTAVKEIAEEVGYVSSNTFCRAFKRLTGISASEYREIKN